MGEASISFSGALVVHSVSALGLAVSYWISLFVYASSLVSDPVTALGVVLVAEAPLVILIYSFIRKDSLHCSYCKAVGRGVLGLPLGALLNAFGAIALGAPVGLDYWLKTLNWSLLMSLFTFVPAACVFGFSKNDWQHLLDLSKTTEGLYFMISLPAYGAIIGGWIGAWPMPLDWERPWQEWPICVAYGAVAGYLLGTLASLAFLAFRKTHAKSD